MEYSKSKQRWISTNSGIEQQGVSLWMFTGNQVYAFLGSMIAGLIIGIAVGKMGMPIRSSFLCGLLVPMTSTVVLLRLVVGKPSGYLNDYIEEQCIRKLGAKLLNNKPKTYFTNED